jgi:hypothetical protein
MTVTPESTNFSNAYKLNGFLTFAKVFSYGTWRPYWFILASKKKYFGGGAKSLDKVSTNYSLF